MTSPDSNRKNGEKNSGIQSRVAFASGLFQGDVTIRTILESLAEGVVIIDNFGTILLVNASAEQMFGLQREELVGRSQALLIPERLRQSEEGYLARLFAEPMNRPMDQFPVLTGLRRDGSEFPMEISLGFIETINGLLLLALVSDVTRRREAERQLKESEDLFHIQIARVKDYAIYTLDSVGKVLNWNAGAERLKGYRAEEIIGQNFSIFYPEEDRIAGKPLEKLKIAAAKGQATDEGWRIRKDGSRFWAEVIVTALHDESGKLLGFSKVTHDISVRKKAEEALLSSEARYRALFENSMDAVFLTVPDGKITAANPAACALFGRSEEEFRRMGRAGVIDPDDTRLAAVLLERAASGKILCELTCVRKDGTKFPAEISSVVMDEGRRSFVILHDITKRKKAEETLQRYSQRLIVLEDDLRKTIAMELHDDIAQEIAALGLNLGHLRHSLPIESGNQVRALLDDARMLTKEINRTVRNLMVDLHPPVLDDFGLAEAIRSCVALCGLRTGIQIDLHADPEFPRLPAEKEIALFRIFQEALNNVAKHAAAIRVSVSLQSGDGSVRLSINDNGKGFAPQASSPIPTGTGWGLTIMRERAKLVGGSFRLDTQPGEGTSILVEIRQGD
jgi:PAS domain S-box-containing protein